MDSRAAVQDLKASFNAAMTELGEALTHFGQSIKAACGDGLVYSRNTMRTSYHLIGQHTFPIENEIYHHDAGEPTPFKNYSNKIGIGILFLPIIVPTIISSFTWIPLIGNSITSAVKGFAHVANLPRLDCTNKTVGYPRVLGIDTGNDERGLIRNLYGAPGYLIGAAIALPVAAVIAFGRFISNTLKSFVFAWTAIVDGVTSDATYEDGSHVYKFGLHDTRHTAKRVIGGLGYALGGVIGGISALAILAARGMFNLIYHSSRSFGRTFAGFWNISTSVGRKESEKDDYKIELENDERHWVRKYVFGGIGYILGGVIGSVTALTVFAARGIYNLFYHSARSFGSLFATLWKFAKNIGGKNFDATDIVSTIDNDKRHPVKRFGFGGIGYALGLAAGSVAATIVLAVRGVFNLFYHSARSFGRMFATLWKFAVNIGGKHYADTDIVGGLVNDDRHPVKRFGFGGIGYALGAVTGGIAAAAVFAVRGVFNLFYHSALSFRSLFMMFFRFSATIGGKYSDTTHMLSSITDDKRHEVKRFGFGAIGYALGAVAGSVAAAATFVVRGIFNLFYHSGRSFGRTFAGFWNIAASDKRNNDGEYEYHIAISPEDDRHWIKRYVFGGIGYVLGTLVGSLTTFLSLASRGIFNFFYHSARSFGRSFALPWNFATSVGRKDSEKDQQKIELEDSDRPWTKAYLLGGLGTILGFVAGGIAAAVVFAVRGLFNLMYHTMRSFSSMFMLVTRFAANIGGKNGSADYITSSITQDDRNPVKQFGFGGIGYILGAAVGGVAAVAIFAVRGIFNFLYHSLRSFGSLFTTMTRFAANIGGKNYDTNYITQPLVDDHANRHAFKRFGFGGIGYILGAAVGGVAAVAIFAVRGIFNTIYHSLRSLGRMFQMMTRFAYHVGDESWDRDWVTTSLVDDDRHPVKRFAFGGVGYVVGAALGAAAAAVIFGLRILKNIHKESLLSAGGVFSTFFSFAATVGRESFDGKAVASGLYNSERGPVRTFIFGGVGYLAGIAFGLVAATITFAVRGIFNLIYHSARSFGRIFAAMWNFATSDARDEFGDLKYKITFDKPEDDRHPVKKILFGGVGYILGAVIGSIAALGVWAVRGIFSFTENSLFSFRALAGSLLNGAGHRHWFEGLGGDERPGTEKALGVFGYVAAAVIVAPIATLIFVAKKVPMVLAAALMIVLSPITAFFKLCGRADRFTIFKAPVNTDVVINQKFKNLFSSLNGTGKFVPGTQIQTDGTGKEKVSLFFFKSVKLNLNSLTENVLKELLNSYYKSDNKAGFFDSAEYSDAIQRVKDKFTVGAFGTVQDMEDDHRRISQIAIFVRNYIANNNDKVPADLYNVPDRMTWGQNFRNCFWGGKLADKSLHAASSDDNASLTHEHSEENFLPAGL